MTATNGVFKGSTTARLNRIEQDIKELRDDVKAMRDTQSRFLGVIGAGAFVLPLILKVIWP